MVEQQEKSQIELKQKLEAEAKAHKLQKEKVAAEEKAKSDAIKAK